MSVRERATEAPAVRTTPCDSPIVVTSGMGSLRPIATRHRHSQADLPLPYQGANESKGSSKLPCLVDQLKGIQGGSRRPECPPIQPRRNHRWKGCQASLPGCGNRMQMTASVPCFSYGKRYGSSLPCSSDDSAMSFRLNIQLQDSPLILPS